MGETKTRKPRAPKPLPLLPLSTSRDALALQAQLNEARNMLASSGEDEARTTAGQVAARAMATGLQSEIERLSGEIRGLGFEPDADAAPALEGGRHD